MPNWVTNVITGPVEIVDCLTRFNTEQDLIKHDSEELQRQLWLSEFGISNYERKSLDMTTRFVDFNLLAPEPENIERGSCSGEHAEGVICWLVWNRANWGTKWNGTALKVSENGDMATVRFDTAWSHPRPVIEALIKKLPDATLSIQYADEDLGFNLGAYSSTAGDVVERRFIEGENEAREFAAQLIYGKSYAEITEE